MDRSWLEVAVGGTSRRYELKSGLTSVGARGDVALEAQGGDQLHFWDQPPKMVFVGRGAQPRVNGLPRDEAQLSPGDAIEWAGARLVYGREGGAAQLQELDLAAVAPAAALSVAEQPPPAQAVAPAPSGLHPSEEQTWRRLKAGMLVELGLADRAAARRWQDAVLRGEFEPDSCARDVLGTSTLGPADPRLAERSARLLRDLLMAPMTRGVSGASRRARTAARSGAAFLLAQGIVIALYSALLLLALLILRLRWGWSVDGFLDGIRGLFGTSQG